MANAYQIQCDEPSRSTRSFDDRSSGARQSGIKWLNWAWTRPLNNGPERLVLVALANHANARGECWPSVNRLVAMTCLGERTVRSKLKSLKAKGEISIFQRDGTSSLYTLTPAGDAPLQEMHTAGDAAPPICTRTPPLQEAHPTPAGAAPKLPITPNEHSKEPCVRPEATHTEDSDFDELLSQFEAVYPRLGDRSATAKALRIAVVDGADPATILAGALGYAAEQKGNGRQFVKLSENWLREKRWDRHTETGTQQPDRQKLLEAHAKTIKEGKAHLCTPISNETAWECVRAELVSISQCHAVGKLL